MIALSEAGIAELLKETAGFGDEQRAAIIWAALGAWREIESGITVRLSAQHLDATMDEGWHEHVWTIEAGWAPEPWRDKRSMREGVWGVLNAIAPVTDGERRLLPEFWTDESIAKAVMALGNLAVVNVERAGFWVRLRR